MNKIHTPLVEDEFMQYSMQQNIKVKYYITINE